MKKFLIVLIAFCFFKVDAQVVFSDGFETQNSNAPNAFISPWKKEKSNGVTTAQSWKHFPSATDENRPDLPPTNKKSIVAKGERMAVIEYTASSPSNEWLITEKITLPNNPSRANQISFYSYHKKTGTHKLYIYTNENKSDKVQLWSDASDGTIEYDFDALIEVDIPDSYKGQEVYFGFHLDGSAGRPWALDEVMVEGVISGVDVQIVEILSPTQQDATVYPVGSNIPVIVKLRNNGRTASGDGVEITRKLNEEAESAPQIIQSLEAKEVRIDTLTSQIQVSEQGLNALFLKIAATGDQETSNDTLTGMFYSVGNEVALFNFEVFEEDIDLMNRNVWFDSINNNYKFFSLDGEQPPIGNFEFMDGFPWQVGLSMGVPFYKIWGQRILYATSIFKNPTVAANRWIILPQIKSKGASNSLYMQWDAASMYGGLEDYEVLITEEKDITGKEDISKFTVVEDISGEKKINNPDAADQIPQKRFLDISEYAGKDIYIAFRLKTSGTARGMLGLDNIKVFGNIKRAPAYTVGINDIVFDNTVQVSPNPAKSSIVISSQNQIKGIEIFNLLGQRIYVNKQAQNSDKVSLNVSSYNNGLYIIRVETEKGMFTQKFNVLK